MSDFPSYQTGAALLIENGHLLQESGYNRESGEIERAGTSQQLGWIESTAEVSIANLSGGIKAIGLLIAGHDRTMGNEPEILYGLAGLLQETGDTINALQNAMLTAAEGRSASLAREAREAASTATYKATRKETAPC